MMTDGTRAAGVQTRGDNGSRSGPELVQAAVQAMLACQQDSGGFVASPDFAQYQYSWLRDSSFAAYALDRCGEHGASARYHEWAGAAIDGIARRIDLVTRQREDGYPVDAGALPPARFSLDGSARPDEWPNFQIDGYGTWLWALREHLTGTGGELPADLLRSVRRAARYLGAFALDPCYDVWEENGDAVHTSTLACAYAGLDAAAELLADQGLARRAGEVRAHVLAGAASAGRYQKSTASAEVDGSMIWLATPFGLVDAGDQVFRAAADAIARQLNLAGGIRRFPSDTFYGGGAWPVLTASLGWYLARTGDLAAARRCHDWIAGHIDDRGRLGEQFGGEQQLPEMYREWVDRWGHPARDLLWSHAMYAVLSLELGAASDEFGG